MPPERAHQGWAAAHAPQCAARLIAELAEVARAEVGQLVVFPVVPPENHIQDDAFVGVWRNPYSPQHGDDLKRWIDAYGKAPVGQGSGFAEAPRSARQLELDTAISLCDAAMAEAKRRKALVSVVVVDRSADVIQVDRMDDAAPMTPDAAEALAVTAINFRAPSAAAAKYPDLHALASVTPFKYLPVAGGLPLFKGRRVTGALGVSGVDPEECEAIAQVATGTRETST